MTVLYSSAHCREECQKMNSGAAYTLLAAMLTMRPWDDVVGEDVKRLELKLYIKMHWKTMCVQFWIYWQVTPSLSLSLFLSLSSPLFLILSLPCPLSLYIHVSHSFSLCLSLIHSFSILLILNFYLPLISSLSLCLLHSYLFPRLKSNNTKGEAVMLRAYAKKYFSEILIMLVRTLLRSDALCCSRNHDYDMDWKDIWRMYCT